MLADGFDEIGRDRGGGIAPFRPDVVNHGCDLLVSEMFPWRHRVVVACPIDDDRPLQSVKKNCHEVVVADSGTSENPFAACQRREETGKLGVEGRRINDIFPA